MPARQRWTYLMPLLVVGGLFSCVAAPAGNDPASDITAPVGVDGLPVLGGTLSNNGEVHTYTKDELANRPRPSTTPYKVMPLPRGTTTPRPSSDKPVITAITPLVGEVGETVTITGEHFSTLAASNEVIFFDKVASVDSATSTELKVKVPAGADDGAITLRIGTLSAIGPEDFDVAVKPIILSFEPDVGKRGVKLRLHARNLENAAADNHVKFGDVVATDVEVLNNSDLGLTIPTDIATGTVIVELEVSGLVSTAEYPITE